MKKIINLSLGLSILVFMACSPVLTPFTQKLYEQNQWTKEDLHKIQFYISNDIILRRKAVDGITKIENGKIRTIDGEKIEEILIKRGTPGVFIFSPKEERFAVSFENGVQPKFLIFGPNPKFGERYALLAKEWNRNTGIISYDEKEYYTTSESAFSYLLVDLKKAKRIDRQSRQAEGRKVEY